MVSWPWKNGYLAFVAIFHPDCRPVVLKGRPCERVETLLAWSDDSEEWTILSDDPAQLADTPFIPLGPKGSFDSTIIFGGAVPFTHNDQVHIFYSAGKHSPNILSAFDSRGWWFGQAMARTINVVHRHFLLCTVEPGSSAERLCPSTTGLDCDRRQ